MKKVKRFIAVLVSLSMMIGPFTILPLANYAEEEYNAVANDGFYVATEDSPHYDDIVSTDSTYLYNSEISATTQIPAANSNVTVLEVIDQRGGINNRFPFSMEALTTLMTGEIYDYTTVNTFGTWRRYTGASGPEISSLFGSANLSNIAGDTIIRFVSIDGFTATLSYEFLMAQRFSFPHANSLNVTQGQALGISANDPIEVPTIIDIASGDGTLRLGQRHPNEQTHNLHVRYMAVDDIHGRIAQIVITNERAQPFQSISTTTPTDGSTVAMGSEITLNWEHLGTSDGFVYFTTGDTPETTPEPGITSSLYNFNTWAGLNSQVFRPVVETTNPNSTTFTVKAVVLGRTGLPSATTTFVYNIEGRELQNRPAPVGVTGAEGRIVGTTEEMEFRLDGQLNVWNSATRPETFVDPGIYFVRYAATSAFYASPETGPIVVTAPTRQTQSAPAGLTVELPRNSGERARIIGTTAYMEYSINGVYWTQCGNGFTEVDAGIYHVRFMETTTHFASPAVTITVNKLQRDPPTGLRGDRPIAAGQMGRIIGTTAEMEYTTVGVERWLLCEEGSTAVLPGQYRVRFRETATHEASAPATVIVGDALGTEIVGPPPPPQGDAVLSVYDGSILVRDFTQAEIDALPRIPATVYSAVNTWPSEQTYTADNAVELFTLLSEANISIGGDREITFFATDGFTGTLRMDDLTASRFSFAHGSSTRVQPVLNFQTGGGPRLLFGQLAPQEQTSFAFVDQVDRIVVGGTPSTWGRPTANPSPGSSIREGTPIRLTQPPGAEGKIYYTLDGSIPTMSSNMFNPTSERWFGQRGMTEHPPIIAPSSQEFTITAQIMGLGRRDGEIMRFTYNTTPAADLPQIITERGEGGSVVARIDSSELITNGMLRVTLFQSDLTEAIAEASESTSRVLELRFEAQDTDTSYMEIRLSAESILEMVDLELRELFISGPLGSISYDLEALRTILSYGGLGEVTFILAIADPGSLSTEMQAQIGDRMLFRIQVLHNDVAIASFGNGMANVRLYYEAEVGQIPMVWHIDYGSVVTNVQSNYNIVEGYIVFSRNSHFYFIVGYGYDAINNNFAGLGLDMIYETYYTEQWINPFTDVSSDDWFYDSVGFVFRRRLMLGTRVEPMLFSPEMPMTRGMMAAILYRLSGSPDVSDSNNPFIDVATERWYTDAVKWAAENDIAVGYGDGRFGPGHDITREQMAVIMLNYQLLMDEVLPDIYIDIEFADRNAISDWAVYAVNRLAIQGMLRGRPGGLFDPVASTTRAEIAAILERFILSFESGDIGHSENSKDVL